MTHCLLKQGLIGGMMIAIGTSLSAATANTQQSYMVKDLGTLGGSNSYAKGINQAGHVVGDSDTSSGITHAVLWNKGYKRDLGTLGGSNSYAKGINQAGQVVGYSDTSTGTTHAVLWDKGNKIDLDTIGGINSHSFAFGINNVGQVVGQLYVINSSSPITHTVVWDKGNSIDLGALGSSHTFGAAINNAGQVVGASLTSSFKTHAFLWDKGLMKDLNNLLPPNSGWELAFAQSINDKGQIVGFGRFKGQDHAFLLTPIP